MTQKYPQVDYWTGQNFINDNKCLIPKWNNWLTGGFIPCRQCTRCKARKKWSWKYKILRETNKWQRTWFVTLTYEDTINYDYSQIQKWLKRIRKSGKKLKYVATTEFDSKGERDFNPHHHLAIFCQDDVTRRDLELKWKGGHSKCKLFKPTNAGYIAKYIAKDDHRVRASN